MKPSTKMMKVRVVQHLLCWSVAFLHLLTYMFVHVDLFHILLNLAVQIFLGFALEMRNAWWRVALVYIAGVLAASIGNSIMEPGYCLRGASGGVYAIITAHVAVTIMVMTKNPKSTLQIYKNNY